MMEMILGHVTIVYAICLTLFLLIDSGHCGRNSSLLFIGVNGVAFFLHYTVKISGTVDKNDIQLTSIYFLRLTHRTHV